MAPRTVGDVEDVFFVVFFFHFRRGVAGITGVLNVSSGVAGLAGDNACVAVIEREGVGGQTGGCPRSRAVAVFALQAEQPGVDSRFGMTRGTFGRSSGKHLVLVARNTFDFGVAAIEGEELGVVEAAHPVHAIVAGQAIRAELLFMRGHEYDIGLGVAGGTTIEVNRLKVCLMTRGAVKYSPGKVRLVVDEAKAGLRVVIEGTAIQIGGCPAFRGVAGFAGGRKQPGVDGGFGVAGGTFRWHVFKWIIRMASHAIRRGVLAFEWEVRLAVVKIGHAVHPVVTGKAVGAKILLVLGHERRIISGMVVGTGLLVDTEIIRSVAAGTFQRRGVVIHLMPDQVE